MRLRATTLAVALGVTGLLAATQASANVVNGAVDAYGSATLTISNLTGTPSFSFAPNSFVLAGAFVVDGQSVTLAAGELSQPQPAPPAVTNYVGNAVAGSGTIVGPVTFTGAVPGVGSVTLVLNTSTFTYAAGVFISTFNFGLTVNGQGPVAVQATTVFSGVPEGGSPPNSVTVQVVGTSVGAS